MFLFLSLRPPRVCPANTWEGVKLHVFWAGGGGQKCNLPCFLSPTVFMLKGVAISRQHAQCVFTVMLLCWCMLGKCGAALRILHQKRGFDVVSAHHQSEKNHSLLICFKYELPGIGIPEKDSCLPAPIVTFIPLSPVAGLGQTVNSDFLLDFRNKKTQDRGRK